MSGPIEPPKWLPTWYRIATPLAIWDTMFLLLRPHTYSGTFLGDHVYKAYNDLYVKMDQSYSRPVWEEGKTAHGLATIIALSQWTTDIPLQALCLYLWRKKETTTQGSLLAMLNGLQCFVRTFVFIGTDITSGFESTGQGEPWMKALYYFSNGLWVLFSLATVYDLWPKFVARLTAGEGGEKKNK